jgi:hypothetical protein
MINFLKKRLNLKQLRDGYPGYPWDYEECEDFDCSCVGIHTEDVFRLRKTYAAISVLPWPSYLKGEYSKITKWGFGGVPGVEGGDKYLWIKYFNDFTAKVIAYFKVDVVKGTVELTIHEKDHGTRSYFTWDEFVQQRSSLYERVKKWTSLRSKVRALERENRKLRSLAFKPKVD